MRFPLFIVGAAVATEAVGVDVPTTLEGPTPCELKEMLTGSLGDVVPLCGENTEWNSDEHRCVAVGTSAGECQSRVTAIGGTWTKKLQSDLDGCKNACQASQFIAFNFGGQDDFGCVCYEDFGSGGEHVLTGVVEYGATYDRNGACYTP